MIFFAPGTLLDPPLALAGRGPGCPPAALSDHRYGGLGVSLGDPEAWKPQKGGGCGWTRCPRNWALSHVAQDMARAWFRGVGAHSAAFGAFLRPFGPFLGHIEEFKGTMGLFETAKSNRTCSVRTVSLRLGVLRGFRGLFWAKNGCLWHKLRRFGRAPPNLAPPPRAPPVSFWLKTWIWQGHHLGSRMAKVESSPRRWEGTMAKTARRRDCCLLLLS